MSSAIRRSDGPETGVASEHSGTTDTGPVQSVAFWTIAAIGVAYAVCFVATVVFAAHRYPAFVVLTFLTALSIAVVLLRQSWRGSFDFTRTTTYLTCVFFFPVFVVGSLLVAGQSKHVGFFTYFVSNKGRSIALGQLVVLCAFGSLLFGANLANRASRVVARPGAIRFLDARRKHGRFLVSVVSPDQLALPCIGLMIFGLIGTYWAFRKGFYGYQITDVSTTSALPVYVALLLRCGQFLAWHSWFSAPKRRWRQWVSVAVAVAAVLPEFVLRLSRGLLLEVALVIALAARSALPVVSTKLAAILVATVVGSLGLGVALGSSLRDATKTADRASVKGAKSAAITGARNSAATTGPESSVSATTVAISGPSTTDPGRNTLIPPFRRHKAEGTPIGVASDARVVASTKAPPPTEVKPSSGVAHVAPRSLDRQLSNSGSGISGLRERGLGGIITYAYGRLTDRLDLITTVATVVSNYKAKAGDERRAGVSNDIRQALLGSLIPRFVWPNKPNPPDPHVLGGIYFGNDQNSFGTTVMTDLLRNFGPASIPVGMALLGFCLGVLDIWRRARIGDPLRAMIVMAVLTKGINLESFYGTVFAETVRVLFIIGVASFAIRIWIQVTGALSKTSVSHE